MADGRVIIDTELDTSGAEKKASSLDRDVGSKFDGIGKKVAKVGGAAVVAGATATGALVKSAVESYASYEQLVGGVDTLFKKSSKLVQKYASEAYKTAGMSANEYMETTTSFSASLLQGLGGDTEKAAKIANKAIIDMSDNANKMGTSMESIQNAYQGFAKQNFSMLDNLKLGYGGTQKEMFRLLQDAAKLDETFAKTADFSLDDKGHLEADFNDIIEAIHIVQDNMGITGTTSKEAATTIEGSINQMKGAWQNLVTGLAGGGGDFNELVSQFIDSVQTVGTNLLPVLETALNGIVDLIGKFIPIVIEKLPPLIQKVLPKLVTAGVGIVNALIQGIITAIPMVAQELPSILSTLLTALSSILGQIIQMAPQLAQTVIETLGQAIPILLEQLPTILNQLISGFFDVLGSLFDDLPQLIEMALKLILGLADAILQAIPVFIDKLPSLIQKLIDGLLASLPLLISGVIQLVVGIVRALPKIIISLIRALPRIIKSVVSGLISALPLLIKGAITLVIELVKNLPTIIIELIKAIPSIIGELIIEFIKGVPQMVTGLIKFVKMVVTKGPQIVASLFKKIPTLIKNLIVKFLEIREKIMTVGKNIVTGIWEGIKNAGKWLWDKISGFCDDIVDGFCDFLGIGSPSKVMRDRVGYWMGEGIYEGFEKSDPMGQINKDLDAGIGKLDTSISLNNALNYQRIGEAVSDGIANSNLGISLDGREFGRVVRSTI